MPLTQAKQVEEQIRDAYQYEGRYYPPKSDDIREHLMSNTVDHDEEVKHRYNGFDQSFDKSLTVFHYGDKSVLIVDSSGTRAPY